MKTVYYSSYSDNFVETKNQGKTVPENYKFIKKNPLYNLAGAFLTQVLKLVGLVYGKCALGLKIEGKGKLKSYVKSEKKGYFIYANHTLTLGDVFNPGLYNPVHPYYICDSSNLGIPILGPILPMVGALPIPESIRGKKHLFNAISARVRSKKAISGHTIPVSVLLSRPLFLSQSERICLSSPPPRSTPNGKTTKNLASPSILTVRFLQTKISTKKPAPPL